MKKNYYLSALLLMTFLVSSVQLLKAQTEQVIYTTGFESSEGFVAGTSYNNTTVKFQGPATQQWGVIMGTTTTTGKISDVQSLQMRSYSGNQTAGALYTDFDLAKVTKVTFKAQAYNAESPALNAYYSTDGGVSWSAATQIAVTTTAAEYTYTVSTTGEFPVVRIKLEHPTVNVAGRLTIDDVAVYGMKSATPEVSIPVISATGVSKDTDVFFKTAELAIATSTEGAVLYYTTDGSEPTTSSAVYSAPFVITATTTVKAMGVLDGYTNSSVVTKIITITEPATATVPYTETFNNTLGDWYKFEVAGAKPWTPSVNGATANGYGGGDVESWLISPQFTVPEQGLQFSFNYASKYIGGPLLIKVSTDYKGFDSPATATWTTVATINAPEVQDNDYTVKFSGNINYTETGTLYYALVYDMDAGYSDWRITNAQVSLMPSQPTLSITEVSFGEFAAETGASESKTVTVNGLNLTSDIQVAISGTDAAYFSVNHEVISPVEGTVSDVALTVTYSPMAAGNHLAEITLSSAGAESEVRQLSGVAVWAPIAAPVATAATDITSESFVANWEIVAGATGYTLDVYTKSQANSPATDLFFSEYIEGASNNKAIEIYNGTGAAVDLSAYSVKTFTNGKTDSPYLLALEGTLENNDVYVIYNSSSVEAIAAVGDITSNVTYFNGDDAVSLYKGDALVDVIGSIGHDPGTAWTADGGYSTVDKVLRRKSSVSAGISENPVTGFPTLATEWEVFAIDDFSGLGSHSFDGFSINHTPVTGSPFTVTGANNQTIEGLAASTEYFYTVKAFNENVSSVASTEIGVKTLLVSGVDALRSILVYAYDGIIHIEAAAGEQLEVFDAVGQKLISVTAVEGANKIRTNTTGVVIVKTGNILTKVIL